MVQRQIYIDANTKLVRLGGRPPRIAMTLLVVQLGLFLLFAFSDGPKWIAAHLALSWGQAIGKFEIWQPATALLIHLGVRSLVLDLAALWFFGSALERWWGQKRFLKFFVVTGVVGLLVGLAFGSRMPTALLAGSQGAAMALLLATAIIFPQHLAQVAVGRILPMKTHVLALVMGGAVLLGSLISGLWLDLAMQLGGAACGLFFLGPRRLIQEWRVKRMKKKLHVVDGGRKDSGPYLN